MMKKLSPLICLMGIVIQGQEIVVNDKLIVQLTKNQAVRVKSNDSFFTSYEKQKKLYEEANKKITQAVAIQQYIYDKLTNVNEAFLQGKKMTYIYYYLGSMLANLYELKKITLKNPEYAILYSETYYYIGEESISIKKELEQEILRENKDYLMDPMDREVLITKIYNKVKIINGHIITIINHLKVAKSIPYIEQIPVLNTYVNVDKAIVKDILRKYNYLKN